MYAEVVWTTFDRLPLVASGARTSIEAQLIALCRRLDVEPVAVGLHVLEVFRDQAQAAGEKLIDRPVTFDLLAGTTRLRAQLDAGIPAAEIVAAWETETAAFAATRTPYLLYP